MTNYELSGMLYDKGEKLTGVRYAVYDAGTDGKDWIVAVEMQFEGTVATIYVEPEFDTLRLELDEMKVDSECYIELATLVEPWNGAIGQPVSWIWILKNQQGYEDGMRFEFLSREKETPVIVTMIGIASSIQIYLSEEVDLLTS